MSIGLFKAGKKRHQANQAANLIYKWYKNAICHKNEKPQP